MRHLGKYVNNIYIYIYIYTNFLTYYHISSRFETITEIIRTEDGEVTDGNLNPILPAADITTNKTPTHLGTTEGNTNPPMPQAIDLVARPLDEDGQPITGATIILECGEPLRSYNGNEQDDETYVFYDAIPQNGDEECTMTVEAPG